MSKSKTYALKITTKAERDLKKLKSNKQVKESVLNTIKKLANNPRPHGVEHLGGKEHRVRDGEYRIVYEIDDSPPKVTIGRVRDRKDVYRH